MIPFAISVFMSATGFDKKPLFSAKSIEKDVAKVNDSLYAWRYETSNKQYNTFLAALLQKDSALYNQCLIDSLGWSQILIYCQPMVNYYHRHPGFNDYPVVNVNHTGASEYCKWLTEVYNNDPKRKFKKVQFTLPSSEEWTLAAEAGNSKRRYAWGNWSLQNRKGMYMCNCKHVSQIFAVSDSLGNPTLNEESARSFYASSGLDDRAFYTAQVQTFYPNEFGIFNMNGNVAEMITVKNQAMGGNWNSYGGEVTNTSMKEYKDTSPEVGFRVFMKIVEK
jgi:formylglycine-generating enzyme required for sulfatase activity